LSETLQIGAVSMMNSMVPQIVAHHLDTMMEQMYPGLREQYETTTITNAWNQARKSDPDFRSLPDFDSDSFNEKAAEIAEKNPWLQTWTPTAPNGQPLPIREAIAAKCALGARLMASANQTMTPEKAQALIDLGKKQATTAQRKVTAGKPGKGKSLGSMAETRSGRSMLDVYNDRHRVL
jgi:hypothetical protein